ncbi:hypothetical protein [Sphingobium aquiterrae]|uniref:hypothetical protein n=1 Tax=Sphingobium aquiterrae TaxID=2038656 RepID=UPI00301A58C0
MTMTRRDHAQLLSRARGALETPADLDAEAIRHLIEDLASAEDIVKTGTVTDDRKPEPPTSLPSASIRQLPVMTNADAASIGFAIFNHVPTLPIDIPDGGFTISAKTSEGRRVTFYFRPYRTGGPPRCVDIQCHDGLTVPDGGGVPTPVFDMLVIAEEGRQPYDSRKSPISEKPSIAVLLLDQAAGTD